MGARALSPVLFAPFLLSACVRARGIALIGHPAAAPHKIEHPARADARLVVSFIGHASVLVQMDDKFFLTDPVFTDTVGEVSVRLVEPGIDPQALPTIDAVLISHMHFDHFSMGSIDSIEGKVRRMVLPDGGLVYAADWGFDVREVPTWSAWSFDGATITAVPVRHVGWRYGIDAAWMKKSFTGYVIEYHGMRVYFGGDSGYEKRYFQATAARFPSIDLAMLPIAPIEPRGFMRPRHMDPADALRAFVDLGARHMVPIHFDTFVNSTDREGDAPRALARIAKERGLEAKVELWGIGDQRVIVGR